MPTELPLILGDNGENRIVIYLDTDAKHFWGAMFRHAMTMGISWMGTSIRYHIYPEILTISGLMETPKLEAIPDASPNGVFLWLSGTYADGHAYPERGYWSGVRIAWENIARTRLRVLIAAGDLPENLTVAHDVLSAIHTIYPESRERLEDIPGLIESWAYDEPTATWWRDTVKRWGASGHTVGNRRDIDIPNVPVKPPLPGLDGYDWDDIFDWWYRGGIRVIRTLKDLADAIGASSGTVYNRHSEYKQQYDKKMKPNSESKFSEMK
ncbi:MAG: hypothetical protein WDZ49_09470 [Litorilinea sp.]